MTDGGNGDGSRDDNDGGGGNPLLAALGVPDELVVGVVNALRERGQTVATAESLTAGLVCGALTTVPGSSAVVRGGLVVYATDLKEHLAGVDPVLLATHGAVHPDVAVALAEGARRRCGASWGLGLTGVAGPQAQDDVSPGTVHLGLVGDVESVVRTITVTGDRHAVRSAAVHAAFTLLAERMPASLA